nr:oligosaccharide flippase family protein [Luteimonas sp. MC1895]
MGLRIAGMGFAFLVGVQLARGLGAQGYGIYGVAMSITALLAVPTEFGLPQLVTREVAAANTRSEWGRLKGIVQWASRTSFLVFAVVAVGVLVWLYLSNIAIDSELALTVLAGLTMIPLVALGKIKGATLRGLHHIVKGQLPDILVRPLAFSAFLLVATGLVTRMTPSMAMILGSAGSGVALLVASFMLRKSLPRQVATASVASSSPDWWSAAFPMALSEGMRVLQSHVVILLLAAIAAMSAVGAYRVATSVALIVSVPVTMLSVVCAPVISSLFAGGDNARLQRLLRAIAAGMSLGALLVALPFFVAGDWLIGWVFGAEYLAAVPALQIICLGIVVSGACGAGAALLNMTGNHKHVTKASGISLALLCVTAPVLISYCGILGAAVASASAQIVWSIIMWLDARRVIGLDSSVLSLMFVKS